MNIKADMMRDGRIEVIFSATFVVKDFEAVQNIVETLSKLKNTLECKEEI